MAKMKKPFKIKKRWIVLIIIVGFVAIRLLVPSKNVVGYTEKTVTTQDILAYNSFVGNVTPGADQDILPEASSTVTQVLVSKGDTVKKGDIIAKLDTSNISYNIDVQQATLNQAAISNSYTIAEAERQYSDFKNSIDTGLNSTMQAAQSQLDQAWSALQTAQSNYDKAVDGINNGTYSETYELQLALDSAQTAKNNAQWSYDNAKDRSNEKVDYDAKVIAYNESKTAFETKKNAYDAMEEGEEKDAVKQELDLLETSMNQSKTDMDTAKSVYESHLATYTGQLNEANNLLSQAQTRYDNAKDGVLSNLKSALDSAHNNYDSAYASAESTWMSLTQQLESYSSNVERARATSNNATGQLELNHLKDTLSDYDIVAPTDGVITSLNISVGSVAASNTSVGKISDLNSMKIEIKIDEYSILNATVGSDVSVYVDAIGKTFDGKLTYVAPTATVTSGVSYYDAEVTFTADGTVRSGMSVEVRLTTVDLKDVVAVESADISYHEDHSAYVLVRGENNEAVEQQVEIGSTNGTYTQITDGLRAGDIILVSAFNNTGLEISYDE